MSLNFRGTVTVAQGCVSLWCGDTGTKAASEAPSLAARFPPQPQPAGQAPWTLCRPSSRPLSTGAARWWRFVGMISPSALGGHFEGVGVVWELKCQSAPRPSLSSRVDSWLNAGSSSPWDWEAKTGNPKIPVSPETPSWPAAGMHAEPLSTEWRPETRVLLKPLVSLRAFLPGIRPNCQYSILLGSVSPKNAPGPHSSYFLQTECAWHPRFPGPIHPQEVCLLLTFNPLMAVKPLTEPNRGGQLGSLCLYSGMGRGAVLTNSFPRTP